MANGESRQFGATTKKAKILWLLLSALLAIFAASEKALAGSGCIGWYSTNSNGEISYYNPATGAYTFIADYTTSNNINASAVQPTTGDIYFVNRSTRKLIVYDKTDNSFTERSGTLPNLGSPLGATFDNSGTLYVMYDLFRMIRVNPSTGSQTGSDITYTGIPGDGASPNGTNGDIAFDAAGQMWMVANSSSTNFRLYRISISGTTATATAFSPNISGTSGSIAGLTIAPTSGNFYLSTSATTYQVTPSTGAASSVVATGATDLSGCSVAPDAPTISKSFSPATATSVPAVSTLTLTVGNSNTTEDFLIASLVDTLPSGMTVATPNNLGGTCATVSGNTVTATAGSGTITFNSGGKIPIGGCTITVNTRVTTAGTYANTIAANGLRTLAGNNSAAGSATFTVLPVADLSVVKSQRLGASGTFQTASLTVSQNSVVQYQLLFTNNGTATATAAVLSDNVPGDLTGLTVISQTASTGATCAASFAAAPNQNNLTGSFTGASGATCTIIIQGTAATAGSAVNTARITPANIAVTGDPDCSGSPVTCAGNNVSSVTTVISAVYSISGVVFEDVNYTGGAGRSLSASGGIGRGGARVELYNSSGSFVTTVDTASDGTYSISNLLAGGYTARVVNSTVSSSRSGYVSTLVGVQTFRTGGGAADVNRVGGENPLLVDAAANTTSAALSSLTTSSTTAQSIGSVTIAAANVTGINFGFNFDTIVNVNNSGQGSLHQFILNANALSGADTSIFMISDGAAHAGLASNLPNQLTGGVAVITLSSLLPAMTGTNGASTTIDGTTQTANVGNTNSGALGTGNAVGVDNLALSTVQKPEVQIVDGASLAVGLDLQTTNLTVRGVSIYGFGTSANNNDHANIRLGSSAASALIEQNILGSAATAVADPGSAARSVGDNIRSVGADNGVVRNNIIAFSNGKGFGVEEGSTGWLIENNEIRGNGIGNSNLDGIDLESGGTTGNTVRGNLIYANEGVGVDSYGSNGSNTIVNNTITGNGVGSNSNVETAGVRIYGAGNTVDRNKIYSNYGAGVMVTSAASASTITRNSIYANGTITNNTSAAASNQIGIDLLSASEEVRTGASPYVTLNDSGDADAGGNGLLNFPVLETAQILNGNLILNGFARPGATLEFFVAAPDASGFGEGQTYVVTLIEGSGADTDATAGIYTSPFGGKTVGTDTTSRFSFSLALPSGVSSGTVLTATATSSGATSEFSNTITVGNAPPVIGLVKTVTPDGTQLPGTDLTYTIAFTNSGGQAAANFVLTDPNPANTTLRLNTSTDFKVSSVVNVLPTGLTATVAYSNDGGATFAYTPVSAGGGAAAGYDGSVTHIRWTFAGSLAHTSPTNAGSVSFTVKIR